MGKKTGCVTSGEQAVSTVGGLSGKWHYSCFIGTLSLFVSLCLPPSLSQSTSCRASTLLLIVQQKKGCCLPPINMKCNLVLTRKLNVLSSNWLLESYSTFDRHLQTFSPLDLKALAHACTHPLASCLFYRVTPYV